MRFQIGHHATASGIVLDLWENNEGSQAVVLAVSSRGRPKRSKPEKFDEYLAAGLSYDELCKIFAASKTTICRWAKEEVGRKR